MIVSIFMWGNGDKFTAPPFKTIRLTDLNEYHFDPELQRVIIVNTIISNYLYYE